MRISDWSSDVCSSDLAVGGARRRRREGDDRRDIDERPDAGLAKAGQRRDREAGERDDVEPNKAFLGIGPLDRRGAERARPRIVNEEERKSTSLNTSHQCATSRTSSACKKKKQQNKM